MRSAVSHSQIYFWDIQESECPWAGFETSALAPHVHICVGDIWVQTGRAEDLMPSGTPL